METSEMFLHTLTRKSRQLLISRGLQKYAAGKLEEKIIRKGPTNSVKNSGCYVEIDMTVHVGRV